MTGPEPDAIAATDDVVRTILDDHTVALLREEAASRGVPVDHLIAALLRAASTRVDGLLDRVLDQDPKANEQRISS